MAGELELNYLQVASLGTVHLPSRHRAGGMQFVFALQVAPSFTAALHVVPSQ